MLGSNKIRKIKKGVKKFSLFYSFPPIHRAWKPDKPCEYNHYFCSLVDFAVWTCAGEEPAHTLTSSPKRAALLASSHMPGWLKDSLTLFTCQ